jgi:hypothetical protein
MWSSWLGASGDQMLEFSFSFGTLEKRKCHQEETSVHQQPLLFGSNK